jgi:hypothetical protein
MDLDGLTHNFPRSHMTIDSLNALNLGCPQSRVLSMSQFPECRQCPPSLQCLSTPVHGDSIMTTLVALSVVNENGCGDTILFCFVCYFFFFNNVFLLFCFNLISI